MEHSQPQRHCSKSDIVDIFLPLSFVIMFRLIYIIYTHRKIRFTSCGSVTCTSQSINKTVLNKFIAWILWLHLTWKELSLSLLVVLGVPAICCLPQSSNCDCGFKLQAKTHCLCYWLSGWSASTVQRAYATKIQGIKRPICLDVHRVCWEQSPNTRLIMAHVSGRFWHVVFQF